MTYPLAMMELHTTAVLRNLLCACKRIYVAETSIIQKNVNFSFCNKKAKRLADKHLAMEKEYLRLFTE